MKILLDECVPSRLSRSLPQHDVVTISKAGWAGVKNGELLRRAAGEFSAVLEDVCITSAACTWHKFGRDRINESVVP